MARDLAVIENSLDNLDLSRLKEFNAKLGNIGSGFNKMMAGTYMRDFIMAIDLSAAMYAKAQEASMRAKYAVEEAEAIAFLEKAPTYLSEKGDKVTNEARKAYTAIDGEVMRAKDVYARAVSIETFLKNKMYEFKDALEAIKLQAKDSYLTPFEGMK